MYSSSKSGESDSISISKSVGNELLSRVKVGMTYEEVIDMLKYEGIDVGCGTIIQQYESSEGALYTFEYLSVDGSFVVSKIFLEGDLSEEKNKIISCDISDASYDIFYNCGLLLCIGCF